MAESPRRTTGNRLLGALAVEDLESLPLTRVRIRAGKVLIDPGDEVKHAFFPTEGVISLVVVLADASATEVASIGEEGFVDATSILSLDVSPYEVRCVTDVVAERVEVEDLRRAFGERPAVRDLLLRFTAVMLTSTGRSVACNALHTSEQRLAKWLLMARDRLRSDDLAFTHESLGQVLGMRRATVSQAAESLKAQGLIDYARGKIQILQRGLLEQAACEDYAAFRDEHERLLGPVLGAAALP